MVAISLYRGNLHRVPDVPRRWPMPPRAISVGEFRVLLDRRSRALAQLQASGTATDAEGDAEEEKLPSGEKEEGMGDSGCPKPGQSLVSSSAEVAPENAEGGIVARLEGSKEMVQDVEIGEGDGAGAGGNGPIFDGVNDIEQRKRDLEKKLDVLNEKKHHLVQMLKQILNAEEEMKKRTSIEPPSIRASFPSQADAPTDTGSTIKIAAPRMTVEVNFGGDFSGGGESEEIASHGAQVRHSHHMQSPSPSSASPFNRPMHGFVHHNSASTPRGISTSTSLGSMTASPSRFAPSGHPGHMTSQPMVSISGTHFLASSPSPAGSGSASSVFRDSHLASP
ncbi:unnamed protein product [Spirodela intermedia]|uniref:Uncharacterized protein n=1 Tax=Spirodela intermedia TaxID=51605 RepID=A0A7I8L4F5_SPIIN|nr:unnamed protein product [Spirodela intermedia]